MIGKTLKLSFERVQLTFGLLTPEWEWQATRRDNQTGVRTIFVPIAPCESRVSKNSKHWLCRVASNPFDQSGLEEKRTVWLIEPLPPPTPTLSKEAKAAARKAGFKL